MRAFMVASYGGMLVAMLLAPTAARALGAERLVMRCGGGIVLLAGWGLARHWGDAR